MRAGRAERVTYYFARKLTGTPVDQVPEGYEIYEDPEDAQVFLRHPKPTAILPIELAAARQAVETMASQSRAIVQAEAKSIVVYLADIDEDEITRTLGFLAREGSDLARHREWMLTGTRYVKMMRFTLVDEDKRLFDVERWCFKGSIDDWSHPLSSGSLAQLLGRYVPHLGKQSFFELM